MNKGRVRNAYCVTCDIRFREEPIDYGDLDTALRKTCAKLNLKDVEGKLLMRQNFLIFSINIEERRYYRLSVITR